MPDKAQMTGGLMSPPRLRAARLGLYSQHELIVLMRTDCPICRSEGLAPRSQVMLTAGGRTAYATLYQVDDHFVRPGDAALSEAAWTMLGVAEGDWVEVRHPPALVSLSGVRRRIFGQRLDQGAFDAIVGDVVAGRYNDVHLSAFLTASSVLPLDLAETVALTRSMVQVGDRLSWSAPLVMDKHSIGGLPGNRTTPIVVAIVTAAGLTMPKTSSRAITSPAGTADMMETVTTVDLSLETMRAVVEAEGGCLAWGGAVRLSPADDVFIRVERVLDIDTEGQLIASVLSKKIAAGATHVVLDIPVGPTAKVRGPEAADSMAIRLAEVAAAFGLTTLCLRSDGSQPVGRGIGPALEAADVLAVLRNESDAPEDLRQRACTLAGAALEMGGAAPVGGGVAMARALLAEGRAWSKFQRICEAQGGLHAPPRSLRQEPVLAVASGRVAAVDNRRIARLAKLAGAPDMKAAGLRMLVKIGDRVEAGQPILSVHAESAGALAYALEYAAANPDIIAVET